jgi:hypothetical protein
VLSRTSTVLIGMQRVLDTVTKVRALLLFNNNVEYDDDDAESTRCVDEKCLGIIMDMVLLFLDSVDDDDDAAAADIRGIIAILVMAPRLLARRRPTELDIVLASRQSRGAMARDGPLDAMKGRYKTTNTRGDEEN